MDTRGTWRLDLRGCDLGTGAPGETAPRPEAPINTAPRPEAIDVEVDIAAGATVGDLARALAGHVGYQSSHGDPHGPGAPDAAHLLTLRHGDRVLDPDQPAATGAPRNGTTIRLVHPGPPHDTGSTVAPVIVRDRAGSKRLSYGMNALVPGISITVGHAIRCNDEGADDLSVNGIAVRGNRLVGDGDLLRSGRWTAALELTGVLRPPPVAGPTIARGVSRGAWESRESEPVDLPHPPGRMRSPGFPWLTAAVPLLMAAGAWAVTHSLMLVAFMGFSFVYVIASGIESKLESRAADRFAVAEFREDLAQAEETLSVRRGEQLRRDETHHPSTDEAIEWVNPVSHRLWERSGEHPRPMSVRLGAALRGPDDPAVRPERGRPDLRDELDAACEHNDHVPRPLTVDLAETTGIAIVGDDAVAIDFAVAIVAQLALLTPPGQLSITIDDPDGRWDWVAWLPHVDAIGGHPLEVRHRDRGSGSGPGQASRGSGDTDPVTVWVASDTVGLPEEIRAVVQFDNHGVATWQLDHDRLVEFTPEFTDRDRLEVVARRLAGFEPGSAAPGAGQSMPCAVTLAQLGLPRRTDEIRRVWDGTTSRVRAGARSTAERAGRDATGDPTERGSGLGFALGAVSGGGILALDLERDGPHALVAGTTGAGKSELLRTMALGLATRHPPERLNFLFIDYKGGAAFGPLAGLPHCVGLLTDLGGNGADRTLVALRAELRRRESVLEGHGASHVSDVTAGARPASLVVIIDEFATLVTEVPGFLDGMLDVAQRGRSLGIHMVLATQRPAGVITDAIRANTSLRIALRLPDADDSADVIGTPHAAGLPRETPGRALVRLGYDELITVQVAYSGSTPLERPRVRVRELGRRGPWIDPQDDAQPPGHAGTASELELLTDAVCDAARQGPERQIHHPVPPPLPEFIEFADVCDAHSDVEPPKLVLGLVDEPELQQVGPLLASPERLGGILVVGAPSSGVSSTLMGVAEAALRLGGWKVHAIDATGGLTALAADRARCEVVDAADHEPLRRMLERLTTDCAAADGSDPVRHLLLVDGFGAFEGLQEPINRGWATERVVELAANGRRHGLLVAVAARRRMEVPPSLAHHLGERIVLRVVDEDEAVLMDAPTALASVDLPPGRAWVRNHWAQMVSPPPPARGTRSLPSPRLPSRITTDDLWNLPGHSGSEDWQFPVGLEAGALGEATLDLTDTHALVCGPPGAGCSTALATITASAQRAGVEVMRPDGGVDTLRSAARSAEEAPARRFLVIIEDVDRRVADPEFSEALQTLLEDPRGSNVRVIGAGDPVGLLRCYDDAVHRMRSMRTGLLLGGGAHEIGEVLHHDLQRRDDIPPAVGRGWLVHRSGAAILQVASTQ